MRINKFENKKNDFKIKNKKNIIIKLQNSKTKKLYKPEILKYSEKLKLIK